MGNKAQLSAIEQYTTKYDYIQKYLEQVTEDEKAPQQYFTKLGHLLIDKCVMIYNDPDLGLQNQGVLKKAQRELYKFLEEKSHYDATELSDEVQKNDWMDKEQILLLVKEKNFDKAISKYIDVRNFADAEQFCSAHKKEGLLTKLLEKYFSRYKELKDSSEMEAAEYRRRAIRLMMQNSYGDQLDPKVILEQIPDDWELKTDDYDLASFLSALF